MAYVLVLAEAHDVLALKVAAALQRRGVPVLAVAPVELSLGCRWVCHADATGWRSRLELRGLTLGDADIAAVFNRLAWPRFFPSGRWAGKQDADYAETEFAAFAASWLGDLKAFVLGRPTTGVLWTERRLFEWLALAAAAGLPVRQVRASTDARVVSSRELEAYDPADSPGLSSPVDPRTAGRNPLLVAERVGDVRRAFLAGDEVIGAPDARLIPAVRHLGRLAEADLLECYFAQRSQADGSWVFYGASAFPADAPPPVVESIADVLAVPAGAPG